MCEISQKVMLRGRKALVLCQPEAFAIPITSTWSLAGQDK